MRLSHRWYTTSARFLQALQECRKARLSFRIVGGEMHEYADAPHPVALLRTRPRAATPPSRHRAS
jgi:hypothetical protein